MYELNHLAKFILLVNKGLFYIPWNGCQKLIKKHTKVFSHITSKHLTFEKICFWMVIRARMEPNFLWECLKDNYHTEQGCRFWQRSFKRIT